MLLTTRRISATLILAAALGFLGCSRETVSGMQLSRDLEAAYPGSRIDAAFRAGGVSHLIITMDDSASRTLSDSALRIRGREVARAALQAYEFRDELDSITVMLVREGERGILGGSYSALDVPLDVGQLR
ncbi:MAG: hypothetical protein AB7I33_11130 [Gemmatimonadales bacterium]